MVVLVHLLQDTERTIIPYLNKEKTLEGLINDGYRIEERKNIMSKRIKSRKKSKRKRQKKKNKGHLLSVVHGS